MNEEEKQKEELFNKGISFFNENLYNMSLYYFLPSKTINNEDIVDNYIKKCNENIKERQNTNASKQFLNPKDRQDEETAINRILQSDDNYEILGIPKNATNEQVIEAYKKLIVKYHPDVNTSSKTDELFKKITKAYNKIINNSNKEINPYELMDKVFVEDDLVELMNNAKSDLELKQLTIPTAAKGISSIIRISIFIYVFVHFILPYFFSNNSELYGFVRSDSTPYEKLSKRLKVKYYIGNDFKEKYVTHEEIRNVEKTIEDNYLLYLNKTCDETKENQEKLKKRLIYYKKGTPTYHSIIADIAKFDISICEKLEKYTKRYNSYKHKNDKIEVDDNTNDNNDNDEANEKEETNEEKEEKNKKNDANDDDDEN